MPVKSKKKPKRSRWFIKLPPGSAYSDLIPRRVPPGRQCQHLSRNGHRCEQCAVYESFLWVDVDRSPNMWAVVYLCSAHTAKDDKWRSLECTEGCEQCGKALGLDKAKPKPVGHKCEQCGEISTEVR